MPQLEPLGQFDLWKVSRANRSGVQQVRAVSAYVTGIDQLPGRRRESFPEITDEKFWEFYHIASPFSLLHVSGFYNIYQSLQYIQRNQLQGDFVECGCFLGGAGIFMALVRDHLGISERTIWLLDTFDGFPDGEQDCQIVDNKLMDAMRLDNFRADVEDNFVHCLSHCHHLRFVEGAVEDTLPRLDVRVVSLLRLDTDFYSSTKAELEHLYRKLARGGVLIVDDYGIFRGSRRATDEYLACLPAPPLLNRIDCGVWAGVKP